MGAVHEEQGENGEQAILGLPDLGKVIPIVTLAVGFWSTVSS
ncbi:hypothetical protein [Mucilaginibacter sp.]|nr:hypothetical protein [Mucilaginibacter sp.]